MPTRIDELTLEQKAQMPAWRDKWIDIGLNTERADRPKFEAAVRECYKATNLPDPKAIIWVSSPIVLAFAAPIADHVLKQLGKKGGAVGDAVDGAVRGAVDDAVGDAVDGAVRGAVDGAVRGAVDGAVRDAVDGAVDGAVGGAVDDAVRGAVDGAVGANAKTILKHVSANWYKLFGGQFWVGGWWGSPAFVSFFREVCNLDLGEDINKRAIAYQRTTESACWWWPHNDFVMVSERPEVIHLENGRLHSDHEMAIRWPDGWGLYFLDGVRFTKAEWEKIVHQEYTLETITKANMGADKSAVAQKYLRPDRLLKAVKAKLIHTGIKGTRLYQVDNFMNTSTTQYCMRMKHPSIDREYIEWVHPDIGKQKDADLAQAAAWRDKEGNHIPVEDYLLAVES